MASFYPDKRMYPNHVPEFSGEPKSADFELRCSPEFGQGLFARRAFAEGERVFVFTGLVVPDQSLFTLQAAPGSYIYDPWVMGRVLHSCDPNTICDMATRTFIARRNIAAGEAITMDYETTEDYLYRRFDCGCGAPNCRQHIVGRMARDEQ